jgi:arylsulfatase A-like enzyme
MTSRRNAPRLGFSTALVAAAALAGCRKEEPGEGPRADPSASSSSGAATSAKRNLLLVSLDTTRADALSPWGAPAERTPTLEKLARGATVFETAISPVPLTLPSHATMFTGLDPSRHSVRDNSGYALPETATTLAETLRDSGWRTFAAVAAVILLPRFGLEQGFESYDASGLDVADERSHQRPADAVVDSVLRLLPGREPFFGFVHFYDAHQPCRAPPELERKFGDAYFASIHLADRALGRLLDALKEQGVLERTIVVVTADHGEGRGDHGQTTHGLLLHDATQRVPLLIRVPGFAARRIEGVVATLADLVPTLLQLLEVEPPPGLDGRSLFPALRGRELDAGDAYMESLFPQHGFDFAPLYGVRTPEWKLVLGARPHLWHLADDAKELRDVAAEKPDVVAALTRRVVHLRDERGAPLPVSEHRMTGEELRAFGGLGYVGGSGGAAVDDDASARPDPYDSVAAAEEATQLTHLVDEGKGDQALARLEILARRFPGMVQARQTLGALHGQRGDHEKALDELAAAAKLRPRSPDTQLQAALAAWLAGKPDVARDYVEKATSMPGCPARGFMMLAESRVAVRDLDGARRILRELLGRGDLTAAERSEAQAALKRVGG